jgi:hypothetical protein
MPTVLCSGLKKGVASFNNLCFTQMCFLSNKYSLNCEYICLSVSLFVYGSRKDTPICIEHGTLIPLDEKENKGRHKLQKSVLNPIPSERGMFPK